ncbi:hypothetical protein ACQ4PT_049251 [Festuca glaucescens]
MDIRQTAHLNEYDQDPYVKEFRIYISDKLTSDEARVLPAPWLKYHDARKEECLPRDGQWDAYRLLLLKTGLKLQSMLDWCALNLIGNNSSGTSTKHGMILTGGMIRCCTKCSVASVRSFC